MANKRRKQSLSDNDWGLLFPGEDFQIGNTTLTIVPLDLRTLSSVLRKVDTVIEKLPQVSMADALGGTNNSSVMTFLTATLNEVPEVLSDMSGLAQDDVETLPIEVAVDLFTKCVEVNLAAKDSLLKNLQKLSEGVAQMTQNGPPGKKKVDPIADGLKSVAA